MRTCTAFPGHAGRCWPLLGWRLVARIGDVRERDRGLDAQGVASGGTRRRRGSSRPTTSRRSARRRRSWRCSTRQRGADRRGQGCDHVRPRLPRRDLRHVLVDDQRPGPRTAAGHRDVPTAHAQVPQWRRDRDRAVAGAGVPDHQGSDVRPLGARPHRRSRGLHHGTDRRGPGRQPHPGSQAGGRRRRAGGDVHRLRSVRRRLPERSRPAVHRRQDHPPQRPAPGPARAVRPDRGDGRDDGAVLRVVHQPRRVRGGVPEVDLPRRDRGDERRLPEGQVQEPPLALARPDYGVTHRRSSLRRGGSR